MHVDITSDSKFQYKYHRLWNQCLYLQTAERTRASGRSEDGSVIYVGLSSRPKDVIYRTEAERMYSNERHKERAAPLRTWGIMDNEDERVD